jgi:hypothetical protein
VLVIVVVGGGEMGRVFESTEGSEDEPMPRSSLPTGSAFPHWEMERERERERESPLNQLPLPLPLPLLPLPLPLLHCHHHSTRVT